jgi:hypothetical protein
MRIDDTQRTSRIEDTDMPMVADLESGCEFPCAAAVVVGYAEAVIGVGEGPGSITSVDFIAVATAVETPT